MGTTPSDGDPVNGTVTVTGSATDDVGVTSVVLLVDGAVAGTTAPATDGSVSIAWNSATLANGSHTVQLRARDAAGNTGLSDLVSVTVQNVDDEAPSPPGTLTAVWGSPSKVTLAWSAATDNAAVTGYRVYRDDDPVPLAEPSPQQPAGTSTRASRT